VKPRAATRPTRASPRRTLAFLAFALTLALARAPSAHAAATGTAKAAAAVSPRCVPSALNRSAVLPGGTGLTVSPLPGSYSASPDTQISLLGAAPRALGGVRVRGSRSGAHRGRLRGYSQRDGASFLPSGAFAPGETVTVAGRVRTNAGTRSFSFRFLVAHEDTLPYKRNVASAREPTTVQHFRSRPDLLAPALQLLARAPQAAAGDIFATAQHGPQVLGPMILDEAGKLLWFDPLAHGMEAADLRVQRYGLQPVLTWWQGYAPEQGFGVGEEVIMNSSYRQIGRVRAGNGLKADLHDFRITPAGTALLTVFDPLSCDVSSARGPRTAAVTDSGFQEIDISTGLVRREWHSIDHVALGDSYSNPRTATAVWPFDYFHINSLDTPSPATLLISARNTSALYELDALSGRVLRRIGGKHSNVPVAPGAGTGFQHDATVLPDGAISVFDNGADPKIHSQSRGLLLALSATAGETVITQYLHPTALSAGSQGSMQVLENGDVFIGWGAQPYLSEFSASGALLFDARLAGRYESYRAYRFAWTGAPAQPPVAVSLAPKRGGPVTVYASFNGDTRTTAWRVFGGSSTHSLSLLAAAARTGFETAIATPKRARFVLVQALDQTGRVLASSKAVASTVG
jgi:hypothetical protein